jgi:hypothetical protein
VKKKRKSAWEEALKKMPIPTDEVLARWLREQGYQPPPKATDDKDEDRS